MPIFSAFRSKQESLLPTTIEEQEYEKFKKISDKIEVHYQNQIQQLITNTVSALETQLQIEKEFKLNSAKQKLDANDFALYEKSVENAYTRYRKQRLDEVEKMYQNSDRFIKALFKTNSRKQDKGKKQIELDERRIDKLIPENEQYLHDEKTDEHREHFNTIYRKANDRLRQSVLSNKGGKFKSKTRAKSKTHRYSNKRKRTKKEK